MLVFKVREGERVLVGNAVVKVLSGRRLGIAAPDDVQVYREPVAVRLGLIIDEARPAPARDERKGCDAA